MLHKTLAKRICVICCLFLLANELQAQTELIQQPDTLRLDIVEAQKTFLEKNLSLLAQHYNIQSSQALVEQARKWENPSLSTNQNLYNSQEGFFQHGTASDGTPIGEVYADVQQLIKTANKRGKQIAIARTNVNIAEWQFKSTMRSLRLTLLTDFYTIAQLQGNAQLFDDNMQRLNKLVNAMQAQFQAGDIAKKEYLRVQALIVNLQQDVVENAKNLSDAESELKTLLRVTGNTFIQPAIPDSISNSLPQLNLAQLVDSARQYNTDYQSETYQLQLQNQTLRLQKALAVPDVTVGVNFDQHSTYVPNFFGLDIGLPLPLWDRNQGNIKSARFQVKQEEANMQEADTKLQNDVSNAYEKLLFSAKLNNSTNTQFYKDYQQIYNNIVEAYDKRQISLLEFLDYFGDYENTRQKELQQTLDYRIARIGLNDVIGMDIVH